jgi:glutamine---fructose-6-phosphate transaminase (isomerizing)
MTFAGYAGLVMGACRGFSLAVGIEKDEVFLGSDVLGLAPFTRRADDCAVGREVRLTRFTIADTRKSNLLQCMENELNEHPRAIGETLCRLVNLSTLALALPKFPLDIVQIPRIMISACGSAYYAGLVGRWWFEAIASIPTDCDIASEFRHRRPPLAQGELGLLISRSGESADTLAASRYMRDRGQHVLSVLNASKSSIARVSGAILETATGPEMGVASTKSFTAQLSVPACLALTAACARGTIGPTEESAITQAMLSMPARVAGVLEDYGAIRSVAARLAKARDVLYLGRDNCFPIAQEGALKLKEICYIHAEGYAAGEMKHGPIALIDPAVPVIGIAPSGPLFEKTASNLQEAAARGGQIVVFRDEAGAAKLRSIAVETVILPAVHTFVTPILYVVAVQLLAYLVAVIKDTDIDRQRILATLSIVE